MPLPPNPEPRYVGVIHEPMEWEVYVDRDGRRRKLDWRLKVRNHSPTGLSWGYWGSGCAQCALAILCDAVGVERAERLYQTFKFQKIARLSQDEGWEMSQADVVAWVEAAEKEKQHG